jgi:hypothetical protein
MRNFKFAVFALTFVFSSAFLFAQEDEDLLAFLDAQEKPVKDFTIATFKTTRVISGHSIEMNSKGVLQFLIGHRFDRVNTGALNLYGIDNATIRLGFEYGLTDNFNIGFGRSSFLKHYDGTLKWRLLRQQSGLYTVPLTVTWVSSIHVNSLPWANPDRTNFFTSRLAFHHGLLVARKFNEKLSLQVSPTIVHRNLVVLDNDQNTIFAIGAGASYAITKSLRANIEYHALLPNQIESKIGGESVKNALSIGVDLETGGHVFQLHLSNSRGMTEKFLVGETSGSWSLGDIHFGFNVSRVFTLVKPKSFTL